jgi:glycosyltransferase involved in cell wall biosynthesis
MGVDIERWDFQWKPVDPPRLAFYGGLGSPHNQREALRCLDTIMPLVWERSPEVELWMVGANPPESLKERATGEPRLRVTGFLDDPAPTLASCRAVLCPWVGTYGFRSRLIEAMAVGVPVVATPDAVDGMALGRSEGVFLGTDDRALANHALSLLDPAIGLGASRQARAAVERLYSFDATYGQLPQLVQEAIVRRSSARDTAR